MKKMLFFCVLTLLFSCNDGNLQVKVIDFDDTSIQFCESTVTIGSTIFFKIKESEALILTLQDGVLKNEISDGEITSTVPNESKITYRTFSNNVSKDYFCTNIPPIEPLVIEEVEAQAGNVFITSILKEDGLTYEHTIRLGGISLVNNIGERITDLRVNSFGVVTTKL